MFLIHKYLLLKVFMIHLSKDKRLLYIFESGDSNGLMTHKNI